MKLRRKESFAPEVYTGSLNDIMFFLLLFFLIVSTLFNPNVLNLTLPKAKTPPSSTRQKIELLVDVNKKYYIRYSNANASMADVKNKDLKEITFENLEPELQQAINNNKTTDNIVMLKVDNGLTVQDLVDVLQIGIKLNIKMVLSAQAPQK